MSPLEVNEKIAEAKGYHVDETINGFLFEKVYYKNGIKHYGDHHYNWAENISDAWQLFEEMPESFSIQKDGLQWMVWKRKTNGTVRFTDSADTAPMAIALAWLKWKELK